MIPPRRTKHTPLALMLVLILGWATGCSQIERLRPPAAPPPERDFVVFFEAENDTLTPEAQTVIQQVANEATKVTYRGLQLQAEASGDSAHAAFLADARKKAVANALIMAGIGQDRIDVSALPHQPEDKGVVARRVTIHFLR